MAIEHFYIPGSWDASQSPVGRLIASRVHPQDRLRADAVFAVSAVALVVLYLIAGFVAWAFLTHDGGASAPQAQSFFLFQAAGLFLLLLLCGVGRRPSLTVSVEETQLRICRGKACPEAIPVADIVRVERVPAQSFYQHYRRFQATRPLVGRLSATVVLIHTATETWALGIRQAEQPVFLESVQALVEKTGARSRPSTASSILVA